jgi:hypothetical protein
LRLRHFQPGGFGFVGEIALGGFQDFELGREPLKSLVLLDLREGPIGEYLYPFALMDGVPLAITALQEKVVRRNPRYW